jgi:hypothetical protein
MRQVKKQNLPSKVCHHCGRDFVWRKKWERDWENVLYCSEACRKGRPVPHKLESLISTSLKRRFSK